MLAAFQVRVGLCFQVPCINVSFLAPAAFAAALPPQIAMGVADEKLQPLLPGQLPTELLVLCHACCDFDPDMRPGFATLVEELEGAVATLQVGFRLGYLGVVICRSRCFDVDLGPDTRPSLFTLLEVVLELEGAVAALQVC
jgi:hypothetical protein